MKPKRSKTPRVLIAGLSALMLSQALAAPLCAAATNVTVKETEKETAQEMKVPDWAFTQDAGNLPDSPGNPDDDLNLYVNYDYLKEHQDTDGQNSHQYDGVTEAADKVKTLLEDGKADGTAAEQLKIFYEQAKDFKSRDEQGLSEIQPYLDKIMQAKSVDELNQVLTSEGFPFEVFIRTMIATTDLRKEASVMIVPRFLSADSMEGSESMMDNADTTISIIMAFEEMPVRDQAMMALSRLNQQNLTYNELARFEKSYGKYASNASYMNRTNGLPPEEWGTLYEFYTFDELKEICRNFPLAAMLENAGRSGAETYSVSCSEWIRRLDSLWTEDNLEMIKTISAVQVLTECAPYLDSYFQIGQEGIKEDENCSLKTYESVSMMELCYFLDNFSIKNLTDTMTYILSGNLKDSLGDFSDVVLDKVKSLAVFLDNLGSEESFAKLIKNEELASFAAELYAALPEITQLIAQSDAYEATISGDNDKKYTVEDDGQAFTCCDSVNTFGQLLGELYVEECLDPNAKTRLTDLTDDLIEAYKSLVGQTEWLDDESREAVMEKLDNMRLNILEPEGGYISYDDLQLTATKDGGTLLGNYLTVKNYVREQENARIGQETLARTCWDYYTPLTYNCFYDPESNSINIYPGFLSEFNYGDDFTEEELLGGMGFVIGHEISHAFDYTGCHYDAYGVLNDCLTAEDQAEYDQILERLANYYSSIELEEGVYEDGEKIIGEAGADLCAVGVIEECAKQIEGLDFKQLYYRMAEVWASVCTKGSYKLILAYDTHPLDCLRTNVNVQMYDTFYDTFHIDEDDGMYLPEEQRIRIWG